MLCVHAYTLALESDFVLKTPTGDISGTVSIPTTTEKVPVVLFIAGSGPTDRNGNALRMMLNCNAYKLLADSLLNHHIAMLRFDKRFIGKSVVASGKEEDLRFETYINDVKSWIDTLATDARFSEIIVAGHSEGSLIGMIAAENNPKVAKYISISGIAVTADEIIKEQLSTQPQQVKDLVFPMLDSLKMGKTIDNVPQMLYALLRPSVQPYMISWLKYNPQEEIAKLHIPILILQGTTDIQVDKNQAEKLHAANPKSTLCIIENMNHVLKTCTSTDKTTQMQTYTNPDFPLADGLVTEIVNYIK